MRAKLDTFDIGLLDALQHDNLLTGDQLSERLGRSPSAIARRLRRLRASGAIAADVSVIADEAAGSPLFAVVNIQLERHALKEAEFFRRRLTGSDNVQAYFEVSGMFDVMLVVVAADMDDFNAFADIMLAEQAAVRRYETMFVKKRAKATLRLPVRRLTDLSARR